MCCHFDTKVHERVLKKFGNKDFAVFWKVVYCPIINTDGYLVSPKTNKQWASAGYYALCVDYYRYKINKWNKIHPDQIYNSYNFKSPHGFHVFLTKDEALLKCRREGGKRSSVKVIKCICRKRDLMTAGFGYFCDSGEEPQAVFKEIYVCR